MAQSSSRAPLLLVCGVAVAVVAWQIVLWGGGNASSPADAPAEPDPQPQSTGVVGEPEPAPVPAPLPAAVPADYLLNAGEIASLRAKDLPEDRPVRLGLVLPVPAPGAGPLRARIADLSGRDLEAVAVVQGVAGASANLEIEEGWLAPGTYLIHLTTKEASPFPLRRYPLEVR